MARMLRWATFIVLILMVIGAALSYPRLRARFSAPMQTTPLTTIPTLATIPALSNTDLAAAVVTPVTPRPTLPTATARPAVIIAAPSPTRITTVAPTKPSPSTPQAITATSLLPATITPVVLGPSLDGVETPTPAADARPSEMAGSSRALTTTSNLTHELGGATPAISTTVTLTTGAPHDTITAPAVTAVVTREVVTGGVITDAAVTSAMVTPIVVNPVTVATVPVTATAIISPQQGTAAALGPTANIPSPLYASPDLAGTINGEVNAGDPLTIIGLYTEGNWYLLANGLWIPGAAVDSAPLAMPLVFPTMTPPPSPTPTATFTPLPTATLVGTETPTPTPTSLDEPVCDCSGDTLDCLGNIFANRAEAQQCFEYCFRQVGRDIHLLDPNLNGVACENLP